MLADTPRKPPQLTPVSGGASVNRLENFSPAVMSGEIQLRHSPTEMASLLGSIQHVLSERVCPIVQFVSAYENEGSGGIAFEVAYTAARQTDKRTLFINLNTTPEPSYSPLAQRLQLSLEAFFRSENPQSSPLASLQGLPLFYTELGAIGHGGLAPVNVGFVRTLFNGLRENFDLIILASDAGISQASATLLGGLSDGTVLVVEAERTRTPVIDELKQKIEAAGGRLIGSVLNKRRFYIPRWIYSLFFGRR